MTRRTNAAVAGFSYLIYIVVAYSATVIFAGASAGDGTAARLTSIAAHAGDMRLAVVLTILTSFIAITLGATLYALTRDVDRDLAIIGLACRVCEGLLGAIFIKSKLELVWLATAATQGTATTQALGDLLFNGSRVWNTTLGAMFFAVGSLIFSWLFLRGKTIPGALAWIGVAASALLVVGFPLQIAGLANDSFVRLMWIPMVFFEVPLGLWLIIKGVSPGRQATS